MRNAIVLCSMIGLWACGLSEDGTGAPPTDAVRTPPNGGDTPGTANPPAATDAGPGDTGAAPPPPPPPPDAASPCPTLTGSWSGQLEGTMTGQAQGPVTGTATLLFAAGTAQGEYLLQNGSQLTLIVDVNGTSVPIAQMLAGPAKCGVLNAAQDSQVFGKDVHATAKCTLTDSGCSGTWTAVATDKSGTAGGTFTVKKN